MTESKRSTTLREHFRKTRRLTEDHVSPEALIAYRAESLEPEQVQKVRNHLVACEECSELLLELAKLETKPKELRPEVSQQDLEAAWSQQRERLFPNRKASPIPQSNSPKLSTYSGWVVAAFLALAMGILSFELHSSKQQWANLLESDLPRVFAQEAGNRNTDLPPILEIKSNSLALVLLLMPTGLESDSLQAKFLDKEDNLVLFREGLSAREGLLPIPVTREDLPAEEIRVIVSDQEDNHQNEKIEEYKFQVRYR